jgi:hypothetical protein
MSSDAHYSSSVSYNSIDGAQGLSQRPAMSDQKTHHDAFIYLPKIVLHYTTRRVAFAATIVKGNR